MEEQPLSLFVSVRLFRSAVARRAGVERSGEGEGRKKEGVGDQDGNGDGDRD